MPGPRKKPGSLAPTPGQFAPAKLISPSRIARYFFHECRRYLRYSGTPKELWKSEGIPEPPFDHSPVTRAILEGGYTWEEAVVRDRLAGRVEMADSVSGGRLRDRVFGAEETRDRLADLRPGRAIYQPTLITPPGFYARYGLDPAIVQMSECRPDLIVCDEDPDGPVYRVVDVKASPGLKLSHRIQAALYTLILQHAMAHWCRGDVRVDDWAGIWLAGADAPEPFDTRSIRPPLEDFLEREVQPLFSAPAEHAEWHVYHRCEWCPYFAHCREEMARTDSVSRLPYLSGHARRFLAEQEPPVRSLADLEGLLNDPGRREAIDDCASLRGRRERLKLQVQSLRSGEPIVHEGVSIDLPRGEHVRLVLTIQSEPVSGRVYAFGIRAQGLRDVLGENPDPIVDVAQTPGPESSDNLERRFVRALFGLLRPVHDYNERQAEWRSQKTLQVYVFDTYERDQVTEVLLRRVDDPEVSEQALQVFFHFQRPELIRARNQPALEVFFPVVVLVDVLRDRIAMPIEVAYRFAEAVRVLRPSQLPFAYIENDFFAFPLSNQLRSDAIFAVWHQGKSEYVDRIAREIRNRLSATNGLINGLRERMEAVGRAPIAWPPKFRLPSAFDHRNPTLSRLAFVARHESVVNYLKTRRARMAPLAERIRSGETLRLTHLDGDRFRLDPSQHDFVPEPDRFPDRFLTDDAPDGHLARLSYDDYARKAELHPPSNLPMALASVEAIEAPDDDGAVIRLLLRPSPRFVGPIPGRTYLLDRRFTDFHVDRVIAHLDDLDRLDKSPFVDLVERPDELSCSLDADPKIRRKALELARRHGMTPSQLSAFEGILDRAMRLVWGPPGTGKTHFLALAILCLAEAHRAAGRPFRTLVTAFTHAAIDNALRKAAELQERLGIVRGSIPIAKLDEAKLPGMEKVGTIPAKSGRTGWCWNDDEPIQLLGGTVWAIRKGQGADRADLVVVDEGSQLRVPEASIVLGDLRAGARLLIAGDDRQLPPIVQARYPDPEPGAPVLHRSLFECLKAQDPDRGYTSTLLENWRMSRALCDYPAAQFYTPDYRSATAEIAARRLPMAKPPASSRPDPIVDALVDPNYSMAIGVLDGVRASAENRHEASLVARVVLRLRERLQPGPRRRYPESRAGDEAFWKDGVFIVSPHHVQIAAIRRALAEARDWQGRPAVDTVDRIQGQECEAVIVSYGVSDVEAAINEKEFIYSLNRLNVSITRARSKAIVFLPRPLIEPPLQVYEDDELSEGVAFMQGLVRFAEHRGQVLRFSQTGAGELSVYRVPAR